MSITKKEVRTRFLTNQNEASVEELSEKLKQLKKAANVIRYFSIKKEVTEIEGQTAYLEKNLQEWTNKHCQHNLLYFMPQRQSYINPEPATDEFRYTCIDCGLILNLPESELGKKHVIKTTASFGEVAEYYRKLKKL